jgi:hypothetical protein
VVDLPGRVAAIAQWRFANRAADEWINNSVDYTISSTLRLEETEWNFESPNAFAV